MRDVPRVPAALTIRALLGGAAFVTGLFAAALVLRLVGNDIADRAAALGVLALIATPAIGLAATAVERWHSARMTAFLALIVLGVLAVATIVALVIGP